MLSDRVMEKLGIQSGQQICLVEAPTEIAAALQEAVPADVRVTDYVALRGFDHIFWWPSDLRGLDAQLARFAYCIKPAGSIWLVIPKHQYAAERNMKFTWADMQAIALLTDLVDNKTVSISDTDYATRFVIRIQNRSKYK